MSIPYKYIYLFILLSFFLIDSYNSAAQEICNNGKDDDGDGLIDLFDPDCQCHFNVTDNLLLNGSFESYDHCPVNNTYNSDYKIADYWQYATYTNIGEAYYYHNLNCSYDAGLVGDMPPAMPLPAGNGFISIQNNTYITPIPESQIPKTYVGQCLQAPLKKGIDYTLSFYAGRFRSWDDYKGEIYPFTIALFGNTDCKAVPFGKVYASGNGCPANYPGWILLGKITVNSSGTWVQNKINFTVPYDINIIEVGPDCSVLSPINNLTDSTTFLDYHLYYLDDMHLLPTKDFPFEYIHTQTGESCIGFPVLQAPATANAVYQWYKDSIAIIGATGSTYSVTDTTGINYYNVLITTPQKCITSEPFLIAPGKLNEVKIPSDTALCVNDTILLSTTLPGITYTINGAVSNEVKINTAGNYTITASDNNGCQKLFNTNVTQQNCTDCDMYVPTAFTPNGDGLNDIFKPKLNCYTSTFHCSIFNRWGEKIFESADINKGWDGNFSGIKLPSGAYVYFINYKTKAGIAKTAKGIIVLIL